MKAAGIVSMFALSGLLLSGSSAAHAQTSIYKDHTHGVDIHDSAKVTEDLSRWSSNVEYFSLDRAVELDNGSKLRLDPEFTSLQLGYDVLRWAKLYVAYGQNNLNIDDGSDMRIAGGMELNWWHNDVSDPEFMYGRLSFQSTVEYGHYKSGSDHDIKQRTWNELYADLTVNYEWMIAQRIIDVWHHPYSIAVYAGGAISKISGSTSDLTFLESHDFDETQILGSIAGVDLFISHNLAFGINTQYFNEQTAVGASVRYHFH